MFDVKQIAHGVIVVTVVLAYSSVFSHINDTARSAATSAMDVPPAQVAAGMQSLTEANHSAVVVAHSLQIPSDESSYFQYVINRASLWFNCAFFFLQS